MGLFFAKLRKVFDFSKKNSNFADE